MTSKFKTVKQRPTPNGMMVDFSIDKLEEFLHANDAPQPDFLPEPLTLSYVPQATFDHKPVQKGLDELSTFLNIMMVQLMLIPRKDFYTIFQIPKATGGFRTIKAPNEALGQMFTRIKNIFEYDLHVLPHDAAFAYVKGRSTVQAMQRHQANESMYFLKLDVEDFFGSFTKKAIVTQLAKVYPFTGLHSTVLSYLADVATLDDGLPQGTQLSPVLTNILMVPFDSVFSKRMKEKGFVYTRYADDLLISHKEPFHFKDIVEIVEYIFRLEDYPFKLKTEKTRYGTRKGRNWNLGLMLNKDNQITLGHEYKNRMKVILHKIYHETQVTDDRTCGLFSYLKMVEPAYYNALDSYVKTKYGQSIADLIQPASF